MGPPFPFRSYQQPAQFRMGEVIARTWNVASRNFLTFFVLVGLAQLVPLVVSLYTGYPRSRKVTSDPGVAIGLTLGILLLQVVMSSLSQAIVVFAAFQDLRGKPVNAAESFRQSLSRILPAIVASVLVGLLVGIGSLLCLAPGLIAMAAMAVVLPACVVERLGPVQSMSRSSDLTSGHWWPIIGVGVAWIVIVLIGTVAIEVALPGEESIPKQLAAWVWQVLSGSFSSVYAAILYHDLRASSEGIGIAEIASVFD
jgi:hypothetical protein